MKTIIKRSMAEERYSGDKIVKAMEKAFISVGVEHDADLIADLLRQVEAEFADREQAGVEEIQDAVERVMMANGCFDAAKSYILYREKRAEMRKIREALVAEIGDENLLPVLASIQSSYEHAEA